jgi:hypothetical protein
MPQITLRVPQEKVFLLKDLLGSIGIKNFKIGDMISSKKLNGLKDSANAVFNKYFSWDNNRSELEFE